MFGELSAPFAPSAIHWRAQTVTGDGSKALALAYLDARDVMDRLDEAVGPANWRDSYIETPKGRTFCTLEIRVDGEWIAKTDGAGDTDVEGEKGSISDALKRAAVKWGIGRYLYDLGNVWAPCESYEVEDRGKKRKKWKKWAAGADKAFSDALHRLANSTRETVAIAKINDDKINDDQITRIIEFCEASSIPIADLLKAAKVAKVTDIEATRFDGVMGWIDRRIEKMKEAA